MTRHCNDEHPKIPELKYFIITTMYNVIQLLQDIIVISSSIIYAYAIRQLRYNVSTVKKEIESHFLCAAP